MGFVLSAEHPWATATNATRVDGVLAIRVQLTFILRNERACFAGTPLSDFPQVVACLRRLHEYSSLILQHHLLFRESRWEGWSDTGGEWEEGVEGGCESVWGGGGHVCVCVPGLRMIKE